MTIKLILSNDSIDEGSIDRLTRELLRDIRADVDPTAELPKSEGTAGSKGDVTFIGQVAMSLISGGVIGKLVEQLTSYLNRNRKIVFEVQKPDGTKMNLSYDYVRRKNADEITDARAEFLRQ